MGANWKMNPEEVGVTYSGGSSCKRGRHGRMRAVSRSCRCILIHVPTGLQVAGEIPSGGYSKKEMRKLQAEIYPKLFSELEAKVAKHLRVPGR
jgi:hypothetical protein